MQIIQELEKLNIPKENIIENEPMKKHTTFKIGGTAEYFIKAETKEQIIKIIKYAKQTQIPLTIVGNGSNLLVLDEGIEGIVLQIKNENLNITTNKENVEITVGSGYKIAKLGHKLCECEISGFEELSAIPGTIGGAIYMNAGAHGKEIKDVITSVKCIDKDGNEIEFTTEEMQLGYRTSRFKDKKYIILEAKLKLQKGKKEEIKQKMQEYSNYRKEKQPLEYPNAGSTFKRGKDFITAQLIDQAGLKGYSIGDAEVSTKHSGFIINKGEATAKDILNLVKHVKEEVKKKFDKDIELEIEVIGKERDNSERINAMV